MGYYINSTDCGITTTQYKEAYYNGTYFNYITLLTWLETNFKCSGLCTGQKIKYFSDVNAELPTGSCYAAANNWVQTNFLSYGIVAIVFGFYQLSILYLAFALCLCPKRRRDLTESAVESPSKDIKL